MSAKKFVNVVQLVFYFYILNFKYCPACVAMKFRFWSNQKMSSFYDIINTKIINKTMPTTKYCPCVLCGETIVATTEEDCIAHMQVCSTFGNVHPEGKATNPNAIYTKTKTNEPAAPTITIAAGVAASPTNNEDETRTAATAASRGGIVEVEHMSVTQLRRYIQQAGLSSDDCLEKSELQQRAHEATVRTSQNPFQ